MLAENFGYYSPRQGGAETHLLNGAGHALCGAALDQEAGAGLLVHGKSVHNWSRDTVRQTLRNSPRACPACEEALY